MGFAIFEAEHGRRIARTDLIGERSALATNFAHDVGDFQADLNAHLVIEINLRFDIQLQADIQIIHCFRDAHIGGAGGGNHRDFIADMDFGFLPILHPDARISQNLHIAVIFLQVQLQVGRNRDATAAKMPEGINGDDVLRLRGRCHHRATGYIALRLLISDIQRRESIGILNTQTQEAAALHLQHFHFQHDLRLGAVLRRNQLLGQAYCLWGIFHHQ